MEQIEKNGESVQSFVREDEEDTNKLNDEILTLDDLESLDTATILSFLNNIKCSREFFTFYDFIPFLENLNLPTEQFALFNPEDIILVRGNLLTGNIEIQGSNQRSIDMLADKSTIIDLIKYIGKIEPQSFMLSYDEKLLRITGM